MGIPIPPKKLKVQQVRRNRSYYSTSEARNGTRACKSDCFLRSEHQQGRPIFYHEMVLLVSYLFLKALRVCSEAGSGKLFFHPKVASRRTLPGAGAFSRLQKPMWHSSWFIKRYIVLFEVWSKNFILVNLLHLKQKANKQYHLTPNNPRAPLPQGPNRDKVSDIPR